MRKAFIGELAAKGKVRDPALIAAFADVPRHCFVPSFFMPTTRLWWLAVDSRHPVYYPLVYADTALTTQLAGGIEPDPDAGKIDGSATSGSNPPGLMAAMLEALDLSGTETVLEIGTGTGYNAAVLSHRLGAQRVTTIEIDPVMAELARRRLAVCGYAPTVEIGDGEHGWDLGAPYQRVVGTCSVSRIPRAWIDQTCDGGVIVASLWRDLSTGPLVRLVVDSGAARGRFLPEAGGFIPARSIVPNPLLTMEAISREGDTRDAAVSSYVLDDAHSGFFIALQLRGVTSATFTPDGGGGEHLWLYAPDGSWARLDDITMTVEQCGPRLLWDEVETAHKYWRGLESPTRDRIGLTVNRKGTHTFWVDTPQRPISTAQGTKKGT